MFTKVIAFVLLLASANAIPTGSWPASKGSVKFSAAHVVKAGITFDGGMKTYNRSDITYQGQKEGGAKDAVLLLEPGATLKNAIIGKNQMEGVHCDKHDCVVQNVWWDDVCEDAFSIKEALPAVIGGGARYADDKVIQHNGLGTVTIDGFYVQDFGKLYRSCGTCGAKTRHVEVSNVYAVNPKVSVVTVNSNNKDTAKLSKIKIKSSKSKVTVCARSEATSGSEPKVVGEGPDGKVCIYDTKTIQIVKTRLRALGGDQE